MVLLGMSLIAKPLGPLFAVIAQLSLLMEGKILSLSLRMTADVERYFGHPNCESGLTCKGQ